MNNFSVYLILWIVIAGLLAFVLTGMALNMLRERLMRGDLRRSGTPVSATIITRDREQTTFRDRYGRETYTILFYVRYEYEVAGQRHVHREQVKHDIYDQLREGQTVRAVYSPADPKRARLAVDL